MRLDRQRQRANDKGTDGKMRRRPAWSYTSKVKYHIKQHAPNNQDSANNHGRGRYDRTKTRPAWKEKEGRQNFVHFIPAPGKKKMSLFQAVLYKIWRFKSMVCPYCHREDNILTVWIELGDIKGIS